MRNAVLSVASGITNLLAEKISEMQRSEKSVEEVDTAKVRETSMVICDSDVSW